jgi:hypothetical protein
VLPEVLPEVVPLPEVLPDVVPVVVLPDVLPLVLPEVPSVPVPVVAQALIKVSEAQRAAPISRESWLRFISMKVGKVKTSPLNVQYQKYVVLA